MYMYIQVVLQSNRYCSDINLINLLATEASNRAAQTTLKVPVHLQFILYIYVCVYTYIYTCTEGTCASTMYGSVQCDAYTHTYMY